MSTIYNTHKTLLPKNGPPSLREALRQSTPPVGRSVAITLAVAFTAIFAVRVYRKFLRIRAKRTSSLAVARSVIRAVEKDLQHSALTPFKSRYPRSAADITPESLVLPKIFARFPAFPAPLNLSQRAFVCWDLAVYNSCKEVTIYVPLDTFWRFHMARSVKKQMQVPSERIAAAPSLSACLTLISDEPWSEGGMVRAADTDPVCADALVHSQSDAISSVDNLQVIFRTADAVDHVPCVKPSDTVCVSSTPPRRSGQRVVRKGPVPPKHTERDATSNAVSSESTAASAPRITAAPVGRLKTASVDFVLFLAWKVISQKRVCLALVAASVPLANSCSASSASTSSLRLSSGAARTTCCVCACSPVIAEGD
ncbi:hypothetical protein EVJ58_g9255 [Rhodofomes roseus]|uniref:Uncharacterized protein n=1 Tax=Rhodofomes roseus TaxID=34475 RepID=A0A4Y9XUF6_9APHY|nr:hypothetical protein EVJ58_g9255 [Rhodofomes roseus]